MYFDVDVNSKLLIGGNSDGSLTVYDIKAQAYIGTYPAHFDSLGAVSIGKGLVATGSGQRHFDSIQLEDSSDSEPNVEPDFAEYRNGLRIWSI